jgi:hypothetical protein
LLTGCLAGSRWLAAGWLLAGKLAGCLLHGCMADVMAGWLAGLLVVRWLFIGLNEL